MQIWKNTPRPTRFISSFAGIIKNGFLLELAGANFFNKGLIRSGSAESPGYKKIKDFSCFRSKMVFRTKTFLNSFLVYISPCRSDISLEFLSICFERRFVLRLIFLFHISFSFISHFLSNLFFFHISFYFMFLSFSYIPLFPDDSRFH